MWSVGRGFGPAAELPLGAELPKVHVSQNSCPSGRVSNDQATKSTSPNPKVVVRSPSSESLLFQRILVAAAFAFHIIGDSPSGTGRSELTSARTTFLGRPAASGTRAKRSSGTWTSAATRGNTFLTSYMTDRKHTYAPLDGEINSLAKGERYESRRLELLEPLAHRRH